MKCRYCDGTGTSNSCVNGTFEPCSACDGTGEEVPEDEVLYITDTNFDRITRSPEALAEFMGDVRCDICKLCYNDDNAICPNTKCPNTKEVCKKVWVEWLKQESTE